MDFAIFSAEDALLVSKFINDDVRVIGEIRNRDRSNGNIVSPTCGIERATESKSEVLKQKVYIFLHASSFYVVKLLKKMSVRNTFFFFKFYSKFNKFYLKLSQISAHNFPQIFPKAPKISIKMYSKIFKMVFRNFFEFCLKFFKNFFEFLQNFSKFLSKFP